MLALCLMLLGTCYAQNNASIIGGCAGTYGVFRWHRLEECDFSKM